MNFKVAEKTAEEGAGVPPSPGMEDADQATPPTPSQEVPEIRADELVDIELPGGVKIKTVINENNKRRENVVRPKTDLQVQFFVNLGDKTREVKAEILRFH